MFSMIFKLPEANLNKFTKIIKKFLGKDHKDRFLSMKIRLLMKFVQVIFSILYYKIKKIQYFL